MERGKLKMLVACLLLAGAALCLYSSLRMSPPLPDPRLHEAVGRVLAEQALKLASGGGQITLVVRDTSVFPNPATEMELSGFRDGLGKSGARVVATNAVKLDPLRLVRVPPSDFFEILRRPKDGDVVVSFLGPPMLIPSVKAQLGQKKVWVVALCPGDMPRQVDLRELFEMDLLHAAIISRLDPPLAPPPTDDRPTWFRSYFQLITAANLGDLPLPTGSRSP